MMALLRVCRFLTIAFTLLPATIFAQNAHTPLVNFQVSQPLTLPKQVHKCEVPLVHHLYGNSYYVPAIVQYEPPTDCGDIGSWAGISLNWTVTTSGIQYDRLAGVTLHNVEIWRTSTSEPLPQGVIWTALKDVSKYTPLFSKPGTLIVDLNNIVGQGLTGEYDVTLTATFYQSDSLNPRTSSADLIVPLSTLSSDQSNIFTVPPTGNTTVTLPRHAVSAIVEIQASGNNEEEFWYYNLPNEYLGYVGGATLGNSSFREVRVLVDGQIAGVVFPYPVIFTGAFLPTIWQPIVAYGAYDTPTYTVDLTPFIPLLVDGSPHIISLDVVSDESDHGVNPNWYLSGNIQIALDSSGLPTFGNITRYEVPAYATSQRSMTFLQQPNSYNFTVDASHTLAIDATIISGSGEKTNVIWRQSLQFFNLQTYLSDAEQMLVSQVTSGASISTHNDAPVIADHLEFPLSVVWNTNVSGYEGFGSSADFDHKYNRQYLPSPWETSTDIQSAQHAYGTYISVPAPGYKSTANGTSINQFMYTDTKSNSYYRNVDAVNNTITKDQQGGSLTWDFWPLATGQPEMEPQSVQSQPPFLARGPGLRQIGP